MGDEQETEPNDNSLIDRLLKRHVIQTVAIYVAVEWGAVEILITLTEKRRHRLREAPAAGRQMCRGNSAVRRRQGNRWVENALRGIQLSKDYEMLLEVLDYRSPLMGDGNTMQMIGFGMSNEDDAAADFDANHPAHKILRDGARATWANNPGARNFAVHVIVGVAIRSDDFDLAFEVLNALLDGHNFAGYMMGPGGLRISLPTLSRFRADPRFTELMERVGLVEYWREFGWSERCRPDGDSFSCS